MRSGRGGGRLGVADGPDARGSRRPAGSRHGRGPHRRAGSVPAIRGLIGAVAAVAAGCAAAVEPGAESLKASFAAQIEGIASVSAVDSPVQNAGRQKAEEMEQEGERRQ